MENQNKCENKKTKHLSKGFFLKAFGAVTASTILISLLLAPCTSGAPAAPATIKLGVPMALTGVQSAADVDMYHAYEIAVDDYNNAGGVFVKEFNKKIPLEMIPLDTESDAVKMVAHMETLNAKGVVAYLGGSGGQYFLAAAPIAEKNKLVYISAATGMIGPHRKGYKYLWCPFPKDDVFTQTIFKILNKWVPEGQRPTKVAIFSENTESALEVTYYWKKWAPEFGYKVVLDSLFAPHTKDFSPNILAAKNAGAELLLSFPLIPDGFTMFKQMKELGWKPKAADIIRAAYPAAWGKVLGPIGENVLSCGSAITYQAPFPGVKELNEKFSRRFKQEYIFGGAMYSYQIVQIIANAIERAGSLDRDKIRDAVSTTNMMTVVGQQSFNPDGTSKGDCYALQWQGGKPELVWPPESAAAAGAKKIVYPMPPW